MTKDPQKCLIFPSEWPSFRELDQQLLGRYHDFSTACIVPQLLKISRTLLSMITTRYTNGTRYLIVLNIVRISNAMEYTNPYQLCLRAISNVT